MNVRFNGSVVDQTGDFRIAETFLYKNRDIAEKLRDVSDDIIINVEEALYVPYYDVASLDRFTLTPQFQAYINGELIESSAEPQFVNSNNLEQEIAKKSKAIIRSLEALDQLAKVIKNSSAGK